MIGHSNQCFGTPVSATALLFNTSVLLISATAILFSTSVLLFSATALLFSSSVLLISATAILFSASTLLLCATVLQYCIVFSNTYCVVSYSFISTGLGIPIAI